MIPNHAFNPALLSLAGIPRSIGDSWAIRVAANGGATPSSATIVAINTFYSSLKTAGIDTKMKGINVFAPDSLIAMLTPIVVGSGGNDPWTNSSFVSGDLTVNGLLGGTGKLLNTGLIPATIFSGDNNAGVSVYVSTITGSAAFELGRFGSTGSACFQLSVDYTDGKTRFNAWENATFNGETQVTSPALAGFYSASRVPTNDARIFFANSSNAWAQVTPTNTLTTGGTVASCDAAIVAMATATFGGSILQPTDRRVSFMAFHDGLSSSEGQALYNAVQALRTAFGGGYV